MDTSQRPQQHAECAAGVHTPGPAAKCAPPCALAALEICKMELSTMAWHMDASLSLPGMWSCRTLASSLQHCLYLQPMRTHMLPCLDVHSRHFLTCCYCCKQPVALRMHHSPDNEGVMPSPAAIYNVHAA